MNGEIFRQEIVGELDDDGVALLCSYGWSRRLAVDGNDQLFDTVRGFVFILNKPFVVPDFSVAGREIDGGNE